MPAARPWACQHSPTSPGPGSPPLARQERAAAPGTAPAPGRCGLGLAEDSPSPNLQNQPLQRGSVYAARPSASRMTGVARRYHRKGAAWRSPRATPSTSSAHCDAVSFFSRRLTLGSAPFPG
ncbi:hypothetical protein JIQ42_07644 [Leishmania sp. Namibia]|uniref:hypothetical protein n=1 Tax=Leishmania sp. Namibia TaxID=2802991 RepID=UPI001B6176E7|nr:hypothetical protein JIQ42_07644 [Leishmania sp. Namibia]